MVSVPLELEQTEFGILIPGIPLPEKSQKECALNLRTYGTTPAISFVIFMSVVYEYLPAWSSI